METKPLQQQIAISILRASGNKKLKALLDGGINLEDFFNGNLRNDYSEIEKYHFASKTRRAEAMKLAKDYLPYFSNSKVKLLYYQGDNYPQRLNECPDAPITLYQKGNFDLNASKVVAIVGTRNITDYGRKICKNLITSFRNQNIVVVSGMAFGVDVYIHRLCLENGVPTVGVLGHGFNYMYPAQHRTIASQIMQNGGLITEFLPDVHPDKIHFPMRNRIIAGVSDATIVVESGSKGGSLITADLANGYNREVFAFPGRIDDEHSKGCNQLIKNNRAILINSGEEFMEMMNWKSIGFRSTNTKVVSPSLFDKAEQLSDAEKRVFAYIRKKKEVPKDELMYLFNDLSNELFSIFLNLEINGFVKALPTGYYKSLV